LYNAVLLADLEIAERHNHALAVAYVPVGRDATVVYGALDFRFRNNTGAPIYLAAQADGGNMTVSIFGDVVHKKPISIANYIDQTIPFQEIEEVDADMSPGTSRVEHNGSNGYVARTYRNYLAADGAVLRSEFLAQDSYRPLNKLIAVGPPLDEEVRPALPGETLPPQEQLPNTKPGGGSEPVPQPLEPVGPADPSYNYDEVTT
jgi:hypothetical protein